MLQAHVSLSRVATSSDSVDDEPARVDEAASMALISDHDSVVVDGGAHRVAILSHQGDAWYRLGHSQWLLLLLEKHLLLLLNANLLQLLLQLCLTKHHTMVACGVSHGRAIRD